MLAGPLYGRLAVWWPPAGEHFWLLGFEPCRQTVPLPVTGRVDRCWDVVPSGWGEHSFIRSLMVLPLAILDHLVVLV